MEKKNYNIGLSKVKISTQSKIVICPECKGNGITDIFNGDGYDAKQCDLCKGVRVVKRIVSIEYHGCNIRDDLTEGV